MLGVEKPAPRVSICLPNLNNRRYLPQCLGGIQSQSYQNWELVVVDSHSDDGAWEFLQGAARHDSRILLDQAPRDGIYPNWNRCLERARGEFVAIATSDDTMVPGFLEAMVAALDAHPECGIAECCLEAIDENGAIIAGWWRGTGAARFFGDDYLRPHRRLAPYDGVLHCAIGTVYHSVTQLLLRRTVFAQTGPFPVQFGPSGDFAWGLVAGMTQNVVHVPRFLATWRIHPAQATAGWRADADQRWQMRAMTSASLDRCPPAGAIARISRGALLLPYTLQHYQQAYAEAGSFRARCRVAASLLFRHAGVFSHALLLKCRGRRFDAVAHARRLLGRFRLTHHLVRDGEIFPVCAESRS